MCGHPCTDACHAPYPCPEKTPCSTTITVTCGCGRLRQERRCNAAKAVASKGQVQQPQRPPAVTPLNCDEECSRLERNRSLASALGVEINPSTTVAQNGESALPYSSETLDMYIQLSSSAPLSTLQTYESTLHALATNPTQRSHRFQPAKPSLRAFTHSLAADWGFATEGFDPEPHRHVFVLKPAAWNPPVFGTGNGSAAIGIGGMSVGECVKLRERQRMKEREAQRVAAVEAKASRDAAKASSNGSSSAGDGWAQVAASSRKGTGSSAAPPGSRSGTATPGYGQSTPFSGSMFAALAAGGGDAGSGSAAGLGPKKERLVLRSGVGTGKQLKSQAPPAEPIADSWEEEVEKEEKEEQREREKGSDMSHGGVEDGHDGAEQGPENEAEHRPGNGAGAEGEGETMAEAA